MSASPPVDAPARSAGRTVRAVAWLSWLYTLALAVLALLLWTCSDAWWPVTALMYAPLWPLGLPLVVLVPAVLYLRPRLLGLLLIAVVLWLWPVMGLCLPWRTVFASAATGPRVRVLTCNVHYQQLRAAELRRIIDETRPDIIALQYWSSRHEAELFPPGAWQTQRRDGQFYLASHYALRSARPIDDPVCAVRYELDALNGRLRFVNVHLETPRDGLLAVVHKKEAGIPELEANTRLREEQSADIIRALREESAPLLLSGDFNTPVESVVYREYWAGYTNAFSKAGLGWGQTQFTPKRTAVRIDHLLAGPGWRCRECWVGPFVGSEHRPVFAEWEWVGDE